MVDIVLPGGWPRPRGYSNGTTAEGRMVFVGGQVGWTEEMKFEARDFVGQVHQALRNTAAVLHAAGARPEHVVRMTWFVTDKHEYLDNAAAMGRVYRDVMGKHFPAMSLVQVADLVEDDAKVEIETTAVVPREETGS